MPYKERHSPNVDRQLQTQDFRGYDWDECKSCTFACGAKVVATECKMRKKRWSGLAVRFAVLRITISASLRCDVPVTATNMTRITYTSDGGDDHDIKNDDNKDKYKVLCFICT